MKTETKIQKVKAHLLTGRAITMLQSISWFDYYRLADGIYRLKNRGMDIETEMVVTLGGSRYARYRLKK